MINARTMGLRPVAAVLCLHVSTMPAHAGLGDIQGNNPDPCREVQYEGGLYSTALDPGGQWEDAQAELWVPWALLLAPAQDPGDMRVAVVVNGNGFSIDDYEALAEHLARNGFATVIARRPHGTGTEPAFVLDALAAGLAELGLPDDTKAALVGHSVGGRVVVNAAVLNDDIGSPYNIRAVVGLAPEATGIGHLDGYASPAYLLVYGSQDEDVCGIDAGPPHEAFKAYDDAGTEGTTTCNNPPCLGLEPTLEKAMVYVYGASHAGLVGELPACPFGQCTCDTSAYVLAADQLCITKAYVTGFLRWKLDGISAYETMFRGGWRPNSVNAMASFQEDLYGNPAGSPVRTFMQYSPGARRVIANFEEGVNPLIGTTADVVHELQCSPPPDGVCDPLPYIRHDTGMLLVGWPQRPEHQFVAFGIPGPARNASTYTHLAIRIGQFNCGNACIPEDYVNAPNQDQTVWIGVSDADEVIRWERLEDWGEIPSPDPKLETLEAISAMRTIILPVEVLNGLDVTDLRRVYLAFNPDTRGTIIVDSIEWFRD